MATPVLNTQTKDDLFYNVLPQDKTGGPLIFGGQEVGQGSGPASSGDGGSGFSLPSVNKKVLIAAIIGIVVLSGLGYGVYSWMSDDVTQTPVDQTPIDETPTDQEPIDETPTDVPIEGVTTPADWQKQFFGNSSCLEVNLCGDAVDPDRDGSTNLEEYTGATDPNNRDSDGDGLADGDEVKIFGFDPTKLRTAGDPEYTDTDYAKGGYDSVTGQKYSADKLVEITEKMNQLGLHQPTLTTLGEFLPKIYNFGDASSVIPAGDNPASALPATVEQTAEAKLDRDTQRQGTVKKFGSALLKYYEDIGSFPDTANFVDMAATVKPYNLVATNPVDPINQGQYVYSYAVVDRGQDFLITYYSETQNQVIKYQAANARKDTNVQSASSNDDRRLADLESIRSALLVYSSAHTAGNQDYVFPPTDQLVRSLVPQYLTQIPKDPKTGQVYEYTVSNTFDSFTLKGVLENPPSGTTGYLCNQEECRNY